MLRLSIEGWDLIFRLPAVSKVGGGILFRLLILNSVWILVLVVEDKGPPHCDACVRSVATSFARGLSYYVVGLVLPHFGCNEFDKHNEGFCWGSVKWGSVSEW
jgi:hypothetical protein